MRSLLVRLDLQIAKRCDILRLVGGENRRGKGKCSDQREHRSNHDHRFHTSSGTRPAPANAFSDIVTIAVVNPNTISETTDAAISSSQSMVTTRLPICPDRRCNPVCKSMTETMIGLATC